MAEGYGDLEGFKAWADDRGYSYPVGSGADAQIDAARLKGTDYLEGAYRTRWKGRKTDSTQDRAWPRKNVRDEDGILLDDDVIPTRVIHASYEATRRILDGEDMAPDLPRGGAVKREMVRAGPVSTETEYADTASSRTSYLAIEGLLAGLIRSTAAAWLERV